MFDRATLGVLIALSTTLVGAGATAINLESGPFLSTGITPIQRTLALNPASTSIGLSYDVAAAVLGDCATALGQSGSLEMRFQGEDGRRRVAETCLQLSSYATAAMPASSYAWFVRAHSSLAAGKLGDFNADLIRSQLTGASEQWIADLRVELAETNFDLLSPEALAAHERDLRLLVSSSVGLRNLARRYVAQVDFRERIADIVESMPEASQRRFINNLQAAIAQR